MLLQKKTLLHLDLELRVAEDGQHGTGMVRILLLK